MEFSSNLKTKNDPHAYFHLDLGQIEIIGKSIAGIETVLYIPQWKLCFDTGRAPHFAFHAKFLAISHWHLDHAGGLAYFLGLRRLNRLPPLKILVPQSHYERTEVFLKSLADVSDTKIDYELFHHKQNQVLNSELELRHLPSQHCVDSTGYAVYGSQKKLKKSFQNLNQYELLALKKSGQEIVDQKKEILLAFSGDSTAAFFKKPALTAKYFIMECSFFGDEDEKEKANHYGHAHILDWVKYGEQIESKFILMTHTSQRYSKDEIEKRCRELLPKSLMDRLIIFR